MTNRMPLFVEKMMQFAVSQLGVHEVPRGSNRGPQVNKYLASVGLNPGYAWCMAFVYWCAHQAEIALLEPSPLVRTAGVMRQWLEINPRYKTTTPAPGNIFIMSFGHGTGHTGFVEHVKKDTILTIEGNTNEDGSREGYEVARRQRPITSCHGFIDLLSQ